MSTCRGHDAHHLPTLTARGSPAHSPGMHRSQRSLPGSRWAPSQPAVERGAKRGARAAAIIAIMSVAITMGLATSAFAFPAQLLAGVAPGETWVVCQGYNNTSVSHSGNLQFALDLTADLGGVGGGGCTGSATVTGDRQVVAPGSGTIAWNDGSGFCVNFDAGDSMKLYHTTGPAGGAHVAAGQVVGNVYPAGQGQNAGYAHLHIAAYGGTGCANNNRTPFAGPGSPRMRSARHDIQRWVQSMGRGRS